MSTDSSPVQKFSKTTGNVTSPDFKTLKSSMSFSPSKMSSSTLFTPREQYFNHNLSASVLQHSSSSFRFPQADRFQERNHVGPRSYCASPSSITTRTTTMGFGGRVDVSQLGNKEAGSFPSPARYQIKSEFEKSKTKGKSFGLPWSAYDSVYQPNNKLVSLYHSKQIPGPGTYHHERNPTSNMNKLTMTPKRKMFNENICLDSPKCSKYSPLNHLTESSRFKKVTFGFGEKYDFTKTHNKNPGPGAYSPPSFVDKYRKKIQKARLASDSPARHWMPTHN